MWYPWLSALSFLTAVALSAFATPIARWDDIQVKHSWGDVPAEWETMGYPSAGTTLDLHIALKPDNEGALIDALYEVSDPEHPRYGQHLFKEQAAELVRPSQDTLDLVTAWLVHHGIRPSSISMTHGGGWMTITDVPLFQANQLFGASYQLFRHTKTNETTVRTVSYALPTILHPHIETAVPTTHFASMQAMLETSRSRSFGADAVSGEFTPGLSGRASKGQMSPPILQWLYGANSYVPDENTRNKLGIVGLGNDYPNQTDLTKFMFAYRSEGIYAEYDVLQLNGGGYDQQNPKTNANMQIQYATAMSWPLQVNFISVGGGKKWAEWSDGSPIRGDAMLELLGYLIDHPNVPQTISFSYNLGDENTLPPQYMRRLCNMFGQLGTQGVSVLVASGYDGLGTGECKDASGNIRFSATFPASCPFVTTVGGTTGLPEKAALLTGGGFSNYFERPKYQEGVMPGFFAQVDPRFNGYYNPDARGYPDISAQSESCVIYLYSAVGHGTGTGCSVATAAGMVSLLNNYRISKGNNALGWLNPWLYGGGMRGFNDIKSGWNMGCGFVVGFKAFLGWDAVTGIGTMNVNKLLLALSNLNGKPLPTYQPQPTNQPQDG